MFRSALLESVEYVNEIPNLWYEEVRLLVACRIDSSDSVNFTPPVCIFLLLVKFSLLVLILKDNLSRYRANLGGHCIRRVSIL
jgi:hypothetical protein